MSDVHSAEERRAFELANEAIRHDAAGEQELAAQRWAEASEVADRYLRDADIYYWIKSGYGDALFGVGRHRDSIEVAEQARAWCLRQQQPLASLTIARSHLALGEYEAAAPCLKEVHGLVGDRLFELVDQRHVAAVREAISGHR